MEIRIKGLFWMLFAVAGAMIAAGILWTGVMFGILVILIGLQTLQQEMNERRFGRERSALVKAVQSAHEQMQQEYTFLRQLQERYERRFFRLNKKRIDTEKRIEKTDRMAERKLEKLNRETEKKMEKAYRDIVRKVLEVDNKLMEMSRAFLTTRPRSGRKSFK